MVPVQRFQTFPFRFTYPAEPHPSLVTSIRKAGILTPLLCIEGDKGADLLVLDGYRRLIAARELGLQRVPVAVIPRVSPREMAMRWIYAQMAYRTLNPFEVAGFIKRGAVSFRLSISEMCKLAASEMHFNLPTSLFQDLPNILGFPEALKREAVKRAYSPVFLVKISHRYPAYLLRTVSRLFRYFSLSENQLDRLLEWMEELILRDGVSPDGLLSQDPFHFILLHAVMPTAKKRDVFLRAMYEKRFPERARLDKKLGEIRRKISLVGDVKLVAPRELMGSRFELRIGFKSLRELERVLGKTTYFAKELHKVFDLL